MLDGVFPPSRAPSSFAWSKNNGRFCTGGGLAAVAGTLATSATARLPTIYCITLTSSIDNNSNVTIISARNNSCRNGGNKNSSRNINKAVRTEATRRTTTREVLGAHAPRPPPLLPAPRPQLRPMPTPLPTLTTRRSR